LYAVAGGNRSQELRSELPIPSFATSGLSKGVVFVEIPGALELAAEVKSILA
jgi:hypothetical protein